MNNSEISFRVLQPTSEIFGKKYKVLSEKRKVKVEKIIEKLTAKSEIFNLENCKRKAKAEVLCFHFPFLLLSISHLVR